MQLTLTADLAGPRTLSRPGSFVLARQRADGTILIVAPRPPSPFARIGEQVARFKEALALPFFTEAVKIAAEMDRTLAQIAAVLVPESLPARTARANSPVKVAGLEARYYVRGGADPACATREGLSALVSRVIAGDRDYDADLALLAPEARRAVAVSAMRGWAERKNDEPRQTVIAHRFWAGTRVEVCAA